MEKQLTVKKQADSPEELSDILMVMDTEKKEIHAVKPIDIISEKLLDNNDMLRLLKISARSLQRYRSTGRIPYYMISGKLYYKLSEVQQIIMQSLATPIRRTKENKS